jgi:hypothetical protein
LECDGLTSLLALKKEAEILRNALASKPKQRIKHVIYFVSPETGERLTDCPELVVWE